VAPILKKGPGRPGSNLIVGLVICQLFLMTLASLTQAQVVIVGAPKTERPGKTTGKGRPRPKPKSAAGAEVVNSRSKTNPKKSPPAAASNQGAQGAVDPNSLGFSIVKPPLEEVTAGEKTNQAADPKTAPSPAVPNPTPLPADNKDAARSESPMPVEKNVEATTTTVPTATEAVKTETAGGAATAPPPAAVDEAAEKAKKEQELAAAKAAAEAAEKAKKDQELAAKAAEAKAPPAAEKNVGTALFPSMIEYGFDVISSDVRGKVASSTKKTGRYFSEKITGNVNIEMVEVTGGAFSMGGGDIGVDEKELTKDLGSMIREKVIERLPAESPRHNVTVPAFYIGKFEITQAQWMAVAGLPQVKRFLLNDPSQFKGADLPVERVSWDEAVEFCERLSRATGRKYRLPTEAEWEYAARAGTDTPFHYGSGIVSDWANFDGDRAYLTSSDSGNRGKTVVAGSLGGVNGFGLYDMHGNVWEWCQDNWHDSYQAAPTDGSAWRQGGAPYLKVLRGGGWDSAAVECRVSFRDRLTPTLRLNNVGFRVVVDAGGQLQSK
jgi:formylglycine-generating enzyme required for sulfatase activity